ncbi:hypothetical protein SLE2022_028770 [Rubroshorea leprosula]
MRASALEACLESLAVTSCLSRILYVEEGEWGDGRNRLFVYCDFCEIVSPSITDRLLFHQPEPFLKSQRISNGYKLLEFSGALNHAL